MVITSDQVKKKLDKLKENSAPGPDGITPRMLKLNAKSLAPVLANIYNKSLQSGIVPDDWKKSKCDANFQERCERESRKLPASLPDISAMQGPGILHERHHNRPPSEQCPYKRQSTWIYEA